MSNPPRKNKGELCKLLRENMELLVDQFAHIYRGDVILMGLMSWFKNYNEQVDRGQKPFDEMMLNFIEHVYPYKNQIKNRDETYFQNNVDKLFQQNLGYALSIKKYIMGVDSKGNAVLQPSDKETIWQYFDVFVKLMDRYIELDPAACSKKVK